MKMKNNNFLLALLVIFISSCEPLELQSPFPVQMQESNTDLLAVSKSSLIIEPESFIADQQDRVISTALNGPIIDVQSSELAIAKNSIRKQINKEEVKNNIDVSSGTQKEEIFPISVNFENIPIEYMSVMFSEISGRNIMIGDEVSGLVSAKLNNVPWDKALDSILKVKQLAKYVDEEANIIRIHSQEVLAAQEKYDLEIMQAMEKTRNAQDAVQPLYTEIFKLYYTEAKNVSAEIQSIINGPQDESEGEAVSSGIEITIDERLNYLIVKASESDLEFIQRIISELDVRTKQILIEAFVVEVGSDFDKAFGTRIGQSASNITGDVSKNLTLGKPFYDEDTEQWTMDLVDGGLADNAISSMTGSLGMLFRGNNINLMLELQAMESLGLSKIVSNPKIFTLDNETATITQGLEIPYTTTTDGVASTEFKEANLKLDVTPSVVGDGNIILNIDIV